VITNQTSIQNLEHDKFVIDNNEIAVRTTASIINSLINKPFDSIYQDISGETTNVYTYKLDGVIQLTLTVNYIDSTKDDWISVIRS
jgi:hypothetical protein